MLIPIIKVRGSDGTFEHIVGTNSHDSLFVDEETGGIHYRSRQNCETTERVISGQKYDMYAYEFVGTEPDEHEPDSLIEFVTIEELFKIVMEEMDISTEKKMKFYKMMEEYAEKKTETDKKISEASKGAGIIRIW